jgi:hypothetical protein
MLKVGSAIVADKSESFSRKSLLESLSARMLLTLETE